MLSRLSQAEKAAFIEGLIWIAIVIAGWSWVIYTIGWAEAALLFVACLAVYTVAFVALPAPIRWLSRKLVRK